jgi:hypothetical protein
MTFHFIAFLILLILFMLITLFLQRSRRVLNGGLLLIENGGTDDDSDMKIAGTPPAPEKPDDTAIELEQQKQNGNLSKAQKLSEELAKKIIDEDGVTSFGIDSSESDEVRMQRRLLLAFVVDYFVDKNIDNSILGQVILNHFYDSLKQSVPEFYEDIRESGSFSFYFLCIRNGSNVEHCIGSSFAMLAGYEGDTVMTELGKALFFRFKDIVETAINAYQFA